MNGPTNHASPRSITFAVPERFRTKRNLYEGQIPAEFLGHGVTFQRAMESWQRLGGRPRCRRNRSVLENTNAARQYLLP